MVSLVSCYTYYVYVQVYKIEVIDWKAVTVNVASFSKFYKLSELNDGRAQASDFVGEQLFRAGRRSRYRFREPPLGGRDPRLVRQEDRRQEVRDRLHPGAQSEQQAHVHGYLSDRWHRLQKEVLESVRIARPSNRLGFPFSF